MGKSISQLKRELKHYQSRNKAISRRSELKSAVRREKYKGLSELWGGTKEFGKAVGKSAKRVGGAIGSMGGGIEFTGGDYWNGGSLGGGEQRTYSAPRRKTRTKHKVIYMRQPIRRRRARYRVVYRTPKRIKRRTMRRSYAESEPEGYGMWG